MGAKNTFALFCIGMEFPKGRGGISYGAMGET